MGVVAFLELHMDKSLACVGVCVDSQDFKHLFQTLLP